MRKFNYICIGALLLSSCFSRSALMTQESFSSVQIGSPISQVVEVNGEPYSIDSKGDIEEYTYVERVTSGNRLIYENRYTLGVRNGKVVSKNVKQEKTPPYDLIYQDDPNHNQYP